jgi:hypothetical protein
VPLAIDFIRSFSRHTNQISMNPLGRDGISHRTFDSGERERRANELHASAKVPAGFNSMSVICAGSKAMAQVQIPEVTGGVHRKYQGISLAYSHSPASEVWCRRSPRAIMATGFAHGGAPRCRVE